MAYITFRKVYFGTIIEKERIPTFYCITWYDYKMILNTQIQMSRGRGQGDGRETARTPGKLWRAVQICPLVVSLKTT